MAAVKRLHKLGWAHTDLHGGNVCVEEQNGQLVVTIIDFGYAVSDSREDKQIDREML